VVAAAADNTIKVLDSQTNFEVITATLADHKDFVYTLEVIDSIVVSGSGNGWILFHDLLSPGRKCLYGLGAHQHAVRCIGCLPDKLVTAGDDGKAMIFSYI